MIIRLRRKPDRRVAWNKYEVSVRMKSMMACIMLVSSVAGTMEKGSKPMNWRGEGKPLPSYEGLSKLVPKEMLDVSVMRWGTTSPPTLCVAKIYVFV